MLDDAVSAPVAGEQALIEKSCPSCGGIVFGRTRHKQYCEQCRYARKLEQYRSAADKQRRKMGVPKVKGETFRCRECCSEFIATSKSRAVYCADCRPIVSLRHANISSARRSENEGRRKRFNAWYIQRAKGDPLVKISRMMRTLMHREVGRKSAGRGTWTKLVGYTADQLKIHLERQFLPGMTWDNRGLNGWHIDHIIPISSFSYDSHDHPDFKACWALTNLRPMWAADNIRKKDKRLFLL